MPKIPMDAGRPQAQFLGSSGIFPVPSKHTYLVCSSSELSLPHIPPSAIIFGSDIKFSGPGQVAQLVGVIQMHQGCGVDPGQGLKESTNEGLNGRSNKLMFPSLSSSLSLKTNQ